MNWTVQNVSQDSVTVTDTPIPVSWTPGQVQTVPLTYFLHSAQLSQAVQNQQLCVVNYGAFAPLPPFAPLTYTVLGTPGATGLTPVTLTQNGASPPVTLGPYTVGTVLLNVTALGASGDSLALGFEAWDGTVYYPAQSVIAAVSSVGPVSAAFNPPALAGRFVWTVSGSVSVTALYQLLPD
ncbi:hypothetical protein [Sulfobacillus harzensis]|uniref:Uncharacterized protein n=1 Tax=Sulfobacillus harzensis TaxID=2729629 RepID=A0A7Y0Q0U4_9FIRM|nr:hypothetical protein [Sulfobacillus harzensis]NMP20762.1 hypothetical protein [Sulfobacillus harzensis]